MTTRTRRHLPQSVAELVQTASGLPTAVLRDLATAGRRLGRTPTFDGRCLDPAYLDAVASGAWTAEHALDLQLARATVDRLVLDVPRWHRHAVKQALAGVALGLLLTDVQAPGCQSLRAQLLSVWTAVSRS